MSGSYHPLPFVTEQMVFCALRMPLSICLDYCEVEVCHSVALWGTFFAPVQISLACAPLAFVDPYLASSCCL